MLNNRNFTAEQTKDFSSAVSALDAPLIDNLIPSKIGSITNKTNQKGNLTIQNDLSQLHDFKLAKREWEKYMVKLDKQEYHSLNRKQSESQQSEGFNSRKSKDFYFGLANLSNFIDEAVAPCRLGLLKDILIKIRNQI